MVKDAMNMREAVMQMGTGMPSGGPSVAPPAPHAKTDAGHSLKAAHAAHQKGDHAGAKRHAFKAIRALPAAPAVPPAV